MTPIREGFTIRQSGKGGTAILVFESSFSRGDSFASPELWDQIVDRPGDTCHIIFLRDVAGGGYYRGIAGLGDAIDDTAASLRSIVRRLEATQIVACGADIGAHAALVFGSILGASRVVAVDPVAHLNADELERYNDRRWRTVVAALPEPTLGQRFDALDVMNRSRFHGDAYVLYGTGRGNEANQAAHHNLVHAQWLARSPRVTLCPFPDVWQNLWEELKKRGELDVILRRYLFDEIPREDRTSKQNSPRRSFEASTPPLVSLIKETTTNGSKKVEVVYAVAGNGEAPDVRGVSDEMRRWLAENLLIGQSPKNVIETMKGIRIPDSLAVEEVRVAREHPYIRGALRLQNRLRKRDWLLSVYAKLARMHQGSEYIRRRQKLSREDFFREFYTLNSPVILEGMMDDWPASRRWRLEDLERSFGLVPVHVRVQLKEINKDDLSAPAPLKKMKFSEFGELIRRAGGEGDFCVTSEDPENHDVLASLWDDIGRLPGIIDRPTSRTGTIQLEPGGAPSHYRHEFKNAALAVVCGKLRVRLVPSWDVPTMANSWLNRSSRDGRDPVVPASPDHCERPQVLESLLEAGEILFLPVGWWYFTQSVNVTASVRMTDFFFENDFSSPELINGVL